MSFLYADLPGFWTIEGTGTLTAPLVLGLKRKEPKKGRQHHPTRYARYTVEPLRLPGVLTWTVYVPCVGDGKNNQWSYVLLRDLPLQ